MRSKRRIRLLSLSFRLLALSLKMQPGHWRSVRFLLLKCTEHLSHAIWSLIIINSAFVWPTCGWLPLSSLLHTAFVCYRIINGALSVRIYSTIDQLEYGDTAQWIYAQIVCSLHLEVASLSNKCSAVAAINAFKRISFHLTNNCTEMIKDHPTNHE